MHAIIDYDLSVFKTNQRSTNLKHSNDREFSKVIRVRKLIQTPNVFRIPLVYIVIELYSFQTN